MQLVIKFIKQLNTSKLGRHTSSSENLISNQEDQDDALGDDTFTADLVMGAIMSCRNNKVHVAG